MSPLQGTRKGPSFEQKVADYLGTERRHLRGILDQGDLVHPHWTVEVFCPGRGKPLNLSQKMSEAKAEAVNAGTPGRYCVVTRRTGWPTDEAFFVLPFVIARQEVPDLDLRVLP